MARPVSRRSHGAVPLAWRRWLAAALATAVVVAALALVKAWPI